MLAYSFISMPNHNSFLAVKYCWYFESISLIWHSRGFRFFYCQFRLFLVSTLSLTISQPPLFPFYSVKTFVIRRWFVKRRNFCNQDIFNVPFSQISFFSKKEPFFQISKPILIKQVAFRFPEYTFYGKKESCFFKEPFPVHVTSPDNF